MSDDGGLRVGENLRVESLMVLRRERVGDQQARQAEIGEFAQARRAGTRDREIRGRIRFLHPVVKRGDVRADPRRLVGRAHGRLVVAAGEMDDLQRRSSIRATRG